MSSGGLRQTGGALVGLLVAGALAALLWWLVVPSSGTAAIAVLEPWPDHIGVETVDERPCGADPGPQSTVVVVDVDAGDGDAIGVLGDHLEARGFLVRVPAGGTARTWAGGIATGHDSTVWFGDADALDDHAGEELLVEELSWLRLVIDRLPAPEHDRVLLLHEPGRCRG